MTGDSGESLSSPKMWNECVFSMAQVKPIGGSWASAFMLGPHSRRVITRSGYLKSKKLWHVLQEAVTERALKGAETDSAHQGAEQIGGSLTWGPSESQHFDATTYLPPSFQFLPSKY